MAKGREARLLGPWMTLALVIGGVVGSVGGVVGSVGGVVGLVGGVCSQPLTQKTLCFLSAPFDPGALIVIFTW